MSVYFLYSLNYQSENLSSRPKEVSKYFSIFRKIYSEKNIFIITTKEIKQVVFQEKDIVLCFEFYEFSKLKEIAKYVQIQNAKFGLFFGDSIQYYELIYKQFIPLIDFCFTHELGESTFYENFCGIPSFDHPIFQTNSINLSYLSKPPKILVLENRENYFVHLGQLDNLRFGRGNIREALNKLNKSYKLYGPGSENDEFINYDEINQKLSNCIFGILPCAASSSDPLSRNKELIEYQFKGKIWDYMISGCIPVVDHAPNIHRLGLKEGIHYLSVSSFDLNEFDRISSIPLEKLSEISKNAFNFALDNLSPDNFKSKFNDFYYYLKNTKYSSRKFLLDSRPKNIQAASLDYLSGKKISFKLFFSGFYLTKIKNIFSRIIKNKFKN